MSNQKLKEFRQFIETVVTLTPSQLMEIDNNLQNKNIKTQQSRVLKMLKGKYPYMSAREQLTFEEAGKEMLITHVAVRDMIHKGTLRNLTLEEIARYVAYGEYDTKGNAKAPTIFPEMKEFVKREKKSKDNGAMRRIMIREENGIREKEMLLALEERDISLQSFFDFCVSTRKKVKPILIDTPQLSYTKHRKKHGKDSVFNQRHRVEKEAVEEFDSWLKKEEITREEFFRGILHNFEYHLKRYLGELNEKKTRNIQIHASDEDYEEFTQLLMLHGTTKQKLFSNAFGYALESLRGL